MAASLWILPTLVALAARHPSSPATGELADSSPDELSVTVSAQEAPPRAYQDLMTTWWLYSLEQQATLTDAIGTPPWNWEMDLDTRQLTFERGQTYTIEVFATWSGLDSTVLWSWAPHKDPYPPLVIRQALLARDLGPSTGIGLLTEPQVYLSHRDAFELNLLLSAALSDVHALYRAPYGGSSTFLAITDDALALPPPTTIRTLRVLGEGLEAGLADHEGAVDSYFQQRGFEVIKSEGVWTATHPSGAAVAAYFGDNGMIERLEGAVAPGPL